MPRRIIGAWKTRSRVCVGARLKASGVRGLGFRVEGLGFDGKLSQGEFSVWRRRGNRLRFCCSASAPQPVAASVLAATRSVSPSAKPNEFRNSITKQKSETSLLSKSKPAKQVGAA